jgi:lysophospholipase L1-like esterase
MYQKKFLFLARLASALFLFLSLNSTTSSAQVTGGLPHLKIVQLGDSYSAGNGARSASGEQNYYSVSGCFRSPTNWGSQFAMSLQDTYAVTYINRACSGGVVSEILNERDMKDLIPALKNPDGSCPSPDYPGEEFYKDDSLFSCSRFLKPQIDAIDSSVDLVLMTMGGNDLGFSTIVQNCYSALKTPVLCKDAIKIANDRMDSLKSRLINTFGELRGDKRLRPGARIAYVSYPHLSLDVEYKIAFRYSDMGVTLFEDIYDAGKEIRALELAGEKAQREAVDAANAAAPENYKNYITFYDGTKALFSGHEPDPDTWRENPDRWLHEFDSFTMQEWYHSNALGHENWANALSSMGTFGAESGSIGTAADIDVVFVVDTTGSMGGIIAQVRADLTSLVSQLAATTDSYRVALVSYRDLPERTGWSGDYPSRVDQTFTNDPALIQAAINSLIAEGGGDWQETVFSGIQTAIDLPWRPGVTKVLMVIGDAPALSPEPGTNLTAAQIVANSIAVDPVQAIGVDVGYLNYDGTMGQISAGTGGSVVSGTSGLTTKISEILDQAANQPFAWMGTAYSGKIGQPVLFDGSGSYDPSGLPITLYEWDFDGDGVFDLQTFTATATHVFDAAFNGFTILRVTSDGGTALASARTVVNAEGFVSQGNEDSCKLDENGFSVLIDAEGRFIPCKADSLPELGRDGVTEIYQVFMPRINRLP